MLTLYEKRFGREGLEALLEELGATLQLVEEPDRWFSAERFIALNRAMVERSQDPDMPYRAGRDIVAPATLGPLRLGLMDLVSTKQALEALPRVSKGVSRISNWEVEILGEGLARATFRPDSPAKDDRTFCRNRHGTLESLPEVVGLPMADVTHPICFFEGGAACVYDLEWSDPPQLGPRYWGAVVVLTTLGIAGVAFGSMLGAAALGLAVGVAFAAVTRKTVNNQERQQDAWDTEKLIESNERRVRELSATQQVSDAIRGSLDPQTLVEQVLASLRASLDYDRALYLAVDGDQLVATSGIGFTVSGAGQADIRISMEPRGGRRQAVRQHRQEGDSAADHRRLGVRREAAA